MPANRDIVWSDVGLGCATLLGFGRKDPFTLQEIDDWLTQAFDLGIEHIDAAILYRAHRPIGLTDVWKNRPADKRRVFTKFVRNIIPRTAADEEHEPAGILSGAQPEYAGSTDDFDFSYIGCRAQIESIRYELGLTEQPIEGLAVHDLGHYIVHTYGRDENAPLGRSGFEWSQFDWDMFENGPIAAFQTHTPEHITYAGLAEKFSDSVIEVAERFEVITYAMTTLCNPLLSSGFMDLIEFAQRLQATGRNFKLDLGGIYSGRLFVTTEDPRSHLDTPIDDRPVFNYDAATDQVLNLAGQMYEIARKHDVSMQMLACDFAGAAKVAFPEVVRRIVLASKRIDNIVSTVEMMRTTEVPAKCWEELISAKLVDERWSGVLCAAGR